ncbi:MAG: dicarboxylate/amino acid:cation symporter [Cytophagales bacterium]|nr:dicarboxylate/amino acid:cation symporter [Cytophagales bacterium]
MKKIPSHIQILIGLGLGLIFAIVSIKLGWPTSFTINYIKPFGDVFLNSLKMIAIPLIIASLVIGVNSIEDVTKLSRIGGKTFLIYTSTTVLAVTLGLIIVNIIKPGKVIPEQTRDKLMALYAKEAEQSSITAKEVKKEGPLNFLVDMIPSNLFEALGNNLNLLQVVLVAIIFGIALLKVSARKRKPIILLLEGVNDVIIEVIKFIMKLAPFGVFALIASLLVELAGDGNPNEVFGILYALLWYASTVVFGLAIMIFVIYPLILKSFTKVKYLAFLKGIRPAQLLAFATSSSSATLPVTMERAEKHLGVSEEISSFVLPLGATVNMDGTALYQSIAIVFIAQALGKELSTAAQLMIILQVVISSVGVAGVPGVSIVTTVMILQLTGVPVEGLALVLAPDRILDMCRTATNITGDAVVAVLVASSEGELEAGIHEKLLEDDT